MRSLSLPPATLVARMMEKGREHEISELASGVTLVAKIAQFTTAGYGADRNALIAILADAHSRAKEKMRRVLGLAAARAEAE